MGFYKAYSTDRSRAIAVLYSGSNKTDVPTVEQWQLFGLPGSWITDKEKSVHLCRSGADTDRRTGHHSTVLVRALLDGKQSNVNAGAIVLMSEPVEGIQTVTNKEKATGGTEEESDDDLRERILEADASEETSYIGNNADYKRWAKAVDGIGDAIVIPEWNGPETVKIVCLDQNGEGANKTLLDAVYNYIMAPDNPADRLAPPNTILTVAAPDLVNISYSFTVTVADGFELSTVISGFKKQLESYYKTVADDGAVKYIKVHALLTETPGVEDFTDLLINGSTDNIRIENDEYPYTENVEAKGAE